jgi:single-strand DNA-binding protein
MAGYLNKVQLIGNLGRDPEIRSLQSGGKVVHLSIATTESWSDKRSGERREQTEWHRVVIFSDGLANVVETYLHKGSKVYIEGSLKTRKWTDQRNEDRFTTEIVLQPFNGKLIMLDGANNRDANDGRDSSDDATSREADKQRDSATATDNGLSGDIPF